MKKNEKIRRDNDWKRSEQLKFNFHKCEYEPIWEHAKQMNYVRCDFCKSHYGRGAVAWFIQRTISNSSDCIDKLHTVPCHNIIAGGLTQDLYENYRVPPSSCAGLFGAPMPIEFITPEQDIRAPQTTNKLIKEKYMNTIVLASALHVKCPRCSVRSGWHSYVL
ncbi:unnamed protein product [Thelazia callipaeda]|uniref:C3HC-type domain-containing protein n=1 Tax=Thelazia callipaeda TaxID=103827 RepID=A0A0N5D9R7_THECL|nr:unnamed protein product [Thelazia callipaeda]